MLYTTLSGLKAQLYIESSFTTDDTLLTTLLNASEQAVINYLNPFVTGLTTGTTVTLNLSGTTMNITMSGYTKSHTTVSISVVQATYLLAAHLYTNRQIVSFTQGVEIPYTLKFLLDPYKNFVIC